RDPARQGDHPRRRRGARGAHRRGSCRGGAQARPGAAHAGRDQRGGRGLAGAGHLSHAGGRRAPPPPGATAGSAVGSVTASPPGLDLDALARFLAAFGVDLEAPISGSVIPGGRSNLTYVVTGGPRRLVVRRPPLAHVLPTAHDMAREYRVLSALQGTGIPVPTLIAHCADDSVIGAPFYVMEYVDGHIVRDQLPAAFPATPATRRAMSQALVNTLVLLHA